MIQNIRPKNLPAACSFDIIVNSISNPRCINESRDAKHPEKNHKKI